MSAPPLDAGAKNLLVDKLRQLPARTAPAPAQAPMAPGPVDPFDGAREPEVVRHPTFSDARPRKRIVTQRHLDHFHHGTVFAEILGMLRAGNEAVRGKKLTDPVDESAEVQALMAMVNHIRALVDETPRDTDSASVSRFGNPAFRTLHEKICHATDELMEGIPGLAGPEHARARQELAVYLQESWGNAKRIDYGSGMELNFLCWLLCLVKLGILDLKRDAQALVLRVFWNYMGVMRVIQATYWLEPAGSHGVWGLDDYHFLPFLWGAAQLMDHPYLRPKSIHDPEILAECAPAYMYFSCIQSINHVKTESLRWHSPMLDDISGVRTWNKVNQGMIKMYRAEVLLKLPIAQHIFFGDLLSFGAWDEDDGPIVEDEHGHRFAADEGHSHGHGHGEGQAAGWGDCCGIPIPSVFAAAEKASDRAVRRIPFD